MGASPDAKYKITDISSEYEIVSQPTLAKHISDVWLCCTIEFSDTGKLKWISLIQLGTGHLICLVNH